MTALQEYQRLECTGLWRDTPDGQRREVIVSFGDATLVISEARSGRAITHWSLPAIVRLSGPGPAARYAPARDADEELEIEDESMVSALAKVHHLIEARRPHPGRLRSVLLGGALAAVFGTLFLWVPNALVTQTAASLPFAKRLEIGRAALAELPRLTGTPCDGAEGQEALARLHERLLGPGGELHVVRQGVSRSVSLPGGIIVLSGDLVEAADNAAVVAGEVLAADLGAETADPLVSLLRHAGLRATFTLLTTGDLPAGALSGYGEALLGGAAVPPPDKAILDRFTAAGVPTSPYAYSRDQSGESVLALIEADPFRARAPERAILSDANWVAIQGICGG